MHGLHVEFDCIKQYDRGHDTHNEEDELHVRQGYVHPRHTPPLYAFALGEQSRQQPIMQLMQRVDELHRLQGKVQSRQLPVSRYLPLLHCKQQPVQLQIVQPVLGHLLQTVAALTLVGQYPLAQLIQPVLLLHIKQLVPQA